MKRVYTSKLIILIALLSGFGLNVFAQTTNFTFNGIIGPDASGINGSPQAYVVPAGVTKVAVDMYGGAGGWPCCSWTGTTGGTRALGGRVQCTMNVTPGTTLHVYVGGAGANNLNIGTQCPGGWNGGGVGGAVGSSFCAGGGGESDIRTSTSGSYASSVLIVAGAGGGGGDFGPVGGAGGGIVGGTGQSYPSLTTVGGACGGGQTGPSCITGSALGTQGQGGSCTCYSDGGGGAGWWGGNGGTAGDGAGAGGSSYPAAPNGIVTEITHTQGYSAANGNGFVSITVLCTNPGTIVGPTNVCSGSTITLSNPGASGGTWVSSNTAVATINSSTGVLTGVASGTVTVTYLESNPCGGISATASITVNPLPSAIWGIASTCEGGGTTSLNNSSPLGTWSSSNSNATVDAPTGVLTGVTAGYSVITYTLPTGCYSTTDFTINPLPSPISGTSNFCMGTTVMLIDPTVTGSWTSGNDLVATVNPISGEVSGVSLGIDTIYYTLPTGCYVMWEGTVNPIPDVFAIASQTLCNGGSTTPVVFSGTYPGTIFNWTNSDNSIGLGFSGTGDIISFPATNTSYVPIYGAINVTPFINGCPGTPTAFAINVNPTPNVNASANQAVCNGLTTTDIIFTGNVDSTTFTWTSSDASIGIGAAGTGNILSFHGIDTSAEPITSVVTVMTSAHGCTGSSNSFTLTIYPKPLLNSGLTPHSICDSTNFSYIPASATSTTTFNWMRDTVVGIANSPAFGMDDPNETLVNNSTNQLSVIYIYALQAYGCVDTQNVTVVVNPKPTLSTTLSPSAICDSTVFHYVPNSLTAGVTYSWSRATVSGITNPYASGIDSMNEILVNYTPDPHTVYYVDTLTIDGCQNTQVVSVAVNPKPLLNTPHTITPRRCDSTLVTYVPGSATTGTTFTWSRAAIAGNLAANGGDTISEYLVNHTTATVTIVYVDTLKANGCWNTENVSVNVAPKLLLTSSLTPPSICDSIIFNYTPTSATSGTLFSWVRPFVLGIGLPAGAGTGNPNEQLANTTNDNLNVVYQYTINDSGCTNTQNVVVVVHPTPVLSSDLAPSVCSGTPFMYGPTSYTFGTTFSWSRAKVRYIAPATDTGSGLSIIETLTDSLLTPVTTGYDIKLTANGCSHHQSLIVTVNPSPVAAPISTHPGGTQCSNTMFQNFGTSMPAPAGQYYFWSATNAEVYAQGSGHQYSLIDFKTPGTSVVTLNTHMSGFSCVTNNTFTVSVGSDVSDMPQVVYYNGQFICLQNDFDSYQWGYDDAITLDSTLLAGEVNPNYFNNSPDLTYKYYWVITKKSNGCFQKTYFNIPSGVTPVGSSDQVGIKVYPNPTNEMLNVDINSTLTGSYDLEIMNLLGQKLQSNTVTDHKSMINVSSLPAGIYMLVSYHDGVKVGAVRFVKN